MEFVKKNFDKKISDIKDWINNSDFISIDTELTGLHSLNTNFHDSAEMRYQHLRQHSMHYAVTQFGICLFKYNHENNCVDYTPMNFHLLPSAKSEKDNFMVNIDTLNFLNQNNFDYNKSWREGISSIRYSEYEQLIKEFTSRKNHMLDDKTMGSNEADDFSSLEKLINDCEDFLRDDDKIEITQSASFSSYERYLVKDRLPHRIGCVNGKWIYPTFEKDDMNKRIVKFVKVDHYEEYHRKCTEEYFVKTEESIRQRLKFSEIIKHIGASKKLIIGHNCLLDCLHMYDKFIGPLPESYPGFKKVFTSLFPNVIDTKYMVYQSKNDVFKDLSQYNLEGLFKASSTLETNPVYRVTDGCCIFSEGGQFHTAHYDAMVTGMLFMNLFTNMSMNVFSDADLGCKVTKSFQPEVESWVKPYINKFNLVNAELSFLNMDPSAKDPAKDKKGLFHVTIPEFWRTEDLFFFLAGLTKRTLKDVYDKIKFSWINSVSLLIRVSDDIKPSEITLGIHGEVSIITFEEFHRKPSVTKTNHSVMEEDGFTMAKSKKRKKY